MKLKPLLVIALVIPLLACAGGRRAASVTALNVDRTVYGAIAEVQDTTNTICDKGLIPAPTCIDLNANAIAPALRAGAAYNKALGSDQIAAELPKVFAALQTLLTKLRLVVPLDYRDAILASLTEAYQRAVTAALSPGGVQ